MRDEFPEWAKRVLANRVGHRCSRPDCGVATSGPHSDETKAQNIGTAAHITAASAGGPRYDHSLSNVQRRSPSNGIWLCRNHGVEIDNDTERYSVERLRSWKEDAEKKADRLLGRSPIDQDETERRLEELLVNAEILLEEINKRLHIMDQLRHRLEAPNGWDALVGSKQTEIHQLLSEKVISSWLVINDQPLMRASELLQAFMKTAIDARDHVEPSLFRQLRRRETLQRAIFYLSSAAAETSEARQRVISYLEEWTRRLTPR